MSRRTVAIAAALSVLALGSPLIIANANPLADNLFNSGVDKYYQGDYQGAITDYDKAIEIDSQFEDIYYWRASAKTELGDHQGAIADWTKVIEIYPQSGLDGLSYRNRGVDKAWIEDHEGACVDWKEAASLGDEDAAGWVKEFC